MLACLAIFGATFSPAQGILENIMFKEENAKVGGAGLSTHDQYRVYMAVYQVGVFIARSSVNCFHFERLWIIAFLQVANFVFLMFDG